MNLYNLLSEHDKKVLENFVTEHIIVSEKYVGNELFLEHWAKNKTKLYHLLGNKLIHKIPYEKVISNMELEDDMRALVHADSFCKAYRDFAKALYDKELIDSTQYSNIIYVLAGHVLVKNSIEKIIELNVLSYKKAIKIPIGAKPMKALSKVIEYFSSVEEFSHLVPTPELFEAFRCAHSRVLNNKIMKGNLVFSIHPMDFPTMSDNGYDWSSCMSWVGHGCYHMGTEEMMNSNNVICCYLESINKPLFCFKDMKGRSAEQYSPKEYPEYSWTNKKWRILFYVNKDIICSGKSYPSADKTLTMEALQELRRLAQQNMNWTYDYGPQQYFDHLPLHSDEFDLDDIFYQYPLKKKILFDTQAMYNDMINDHDRSYWCVRNAVNKPKLISISGKVRCICCGSDRVRESNDRDCRDGYNDKVSNTNTLICTTCLEEHFYCGGCDCNSANEDITYFANKPMYNTKSYGKICFKCYEEKMKLCPCCGKEMHLFNDIDPEKLPLIRIKGAKARPSLTNIRKAIYNYKYYDAETSIQETGYAFLTMCMDCAKEYGKNNGYLTWREIKDPEVFDQNSLEEYKANYNPYSYKYDFDNFGQVLYPIALDEDDELISKFKLENLEKLALKEE